MTNGVETFTVSLRLDRRVVDEIDAYASVECVSRTRIIAAVLNQFLKKPPARLVIGPGNKVSKHASRHVSKRVSKPEEFFD